MPLHPVQHGLGDMDPADFRAAAHRVADMVADYLENLEQHAVLPDVTAGDVRSQLPASPPDAPEAMDAILADYLRLVEPNVTHWQHPGFMAYFAAVASGPGILGEWLATGLNSIVMLWRNAPAPTELEETVVEWLRQMLGLPAAFDGMLTDTASISSLLSIVAARHEAPPDLSKLRLYCSDEAHSSIEKGARVAGVPREGVRRITTDSTLAMDPAALSAAIAADRAAGLHPFCVVAMAGTTSSNAIDPLDEIARIARENGCWLHVDAAYGGTAAIVPELRPLLAGWERADSIVTNPHKWLFTPFDCSLLLFRRPEAYRQAFSLVPEYLTVRREGDAHDYHEYGIQLGRRFRALKLWMMIRWFGVDGMVRRVRETCRLAALFAGWVDDTPGWERLAPVPFATVCFRHVPEGLDDDAANAHNERIMAEVNASGSIFLSHTKLRGVYTIRLSVGNPRQTEEHVRRAWDLLQRAAAAR